MFSAPTPAMSRAHASPGAAARAATRPRPAADRLRRFIEEVRRIKQADLPDELAVAVLQSRMSALVTDPLVRRAVPHTHTTTGLYTRLLLNRFEDNFQVVLVVWGPGSQSPIHDHAGTVGAVAALVGQTVETRYQPMGQEGGRVRLRATEDRVLSGATTSTLLPHADEELHAVGNPSAEWAATLHVYLRPVMDFHLFEACGDDLYVPVARPLWFDGDDAGRSW